MEKEFTSEIQDVTLEENILVEEEEMTSRFHDENAIYLYGTVEQTTADSIKRTNMYTIPIKLYETAEISRAMAKGMNILVPKTLRFAVNLDVDNKEYYYDQFTMNDSKIIKRYNIKNIQEYKSKCTYIRELVQEPVSKLKVIQYTIRDTRKLYPNPQYV